MKNISNNIVIAGAGLSGLYIAKYLCSKNVADNIVVIERAVDVGGQFGSFEDEKLGLLDYGMHVYYDACIDGIDSLIQSTLSDDEWNILSDNCKDIAGIFYNGALQEDIPYPDLRGLPIDKQEELIGNLLLSCDKDEIDVCSAYDFYLNQFGEKITQQIFEPIMLKLHGMALSKLDPITSKLTASSRIAFPSHELMLDLSNSQALRSRIAFPDQMKLPQLRVKNQRALYPKKYGFRHVVERLKSDLMAMGVEFRMETKIEKLSYDTRVNSIDVRDEQSGESSSIDNISSLFWGAGMPPLASLLGISIAGLMPDKRPPTYFIYFFLEALPSMGRLYYFYCFDDGYNSFRITNYSSYCPAANTGNGFPVCVEYWPEEGCSDAEHIENAQRELVNMGVLKSDNRVLHSTIRKGGSPPIPSLDNLNSVNKLRDSINNFGLSNLVLSGMLAGKDTFFIPEVLTDAYNKLLKHYP
ncbi:MAG: NAD(P)-binding protein [Pseudomonadales bacterium]|nr:NAD(P)-binding protein [Pseudomonadales bacterium]